MLRNQRVKPMRRIALPSVLRRNVGSSHAKRFVSCSPSRPLRTIAKSLDVVATGFERAREADATRSFGMFSCSKATNEMNYLAQKLARQVMGSNNIDSCNRT